MRLVRLGRKKKSGGGPIHRPPSNERVLKPALKRRLTLLAAFIILVISTTKSIQPAGSDYIMDAKGVAMETIYADQPFKAVDIAATRQAQDAAAEAVPDHFRVDEESVMEHLADFDERVAALAAKRPSIEKAVRQALLESTSDESTQSVVLAAVREVAAAMVEHPPFDEIANADYLAPWLAPSAESIPERIFEGEEHPEPEKNARTSDLSHANASPLPKHAQTIALHPSEEQAMAFTQADWLTDICRTSLEYVLYFGVIDPETLKATGRAIDAQTPVQREIVVLREKQVADMEKSTRFVRADAPVLSKAARLLRDHIRAAGQGTPLSGSLDATENWSDLHNAAFVVASLSLGETLKYDPDTEALRQKARDEVVPIMIQYKAGEQIQQKGLDWTEQSSVAYNALIEAKKAGHQQHSSFYAMLAANSILVALVLWGVAWALPLLVPDRGDTLSRDLSLSLLVMCGTLLIARVIVILQLPGYIVPVAAGAILLAILINTRVAATTSLYTAVLLSVLCDYDWRILIVSGSMSLAGVFSIYKVRKRSDMSMAAVKSTVIGLAAFVAATLATDSRFDDLWTRLGPSALNVVLSGLACLFLVPGLLPPLERLFGITTDIQLLEYSDLNNEVLSRMAIEVPATYAHSLMLGQLAEAACMAIGANGLLARVCAYYHDIGKLRRPEYFSENQIGANVHDSLSPRMSARAISAHVTEGAEMAREFHLPKPLIDAIYEHHGTCRISFFYEQALAQQKHGGLLEEDFRYPGPKPQSRETAILMICDAAESAVRSLKNPNEERVRELVDKIISNRAEDRQFDECALTLKDLDTIEEVVTKRVQTGLHRRIAYPNQKTEPDEQRTELESVKRGMKDEY